jgi:hypothetical protein
MMRTRRLLIAMFVLGASVVATASTTSAGGDGPSAQVETPCGTVTVSTSVSDIHNLTSEAVPAEPAPPEGVEFPCGLLSFNIGEAQSGFTTTITVTLPEGVSATGYWKLQGDWYEISELEISGNIITFALTDGGFGDSDETANGDLVDPGGPVAPVTAAVTPTPVVATPNTTG